MWVHSTASTARLRLRLAAVSVLLTVVDNVPTPPASKFEVLQVAGGGSVVNGSSPLVVMDCHYVIPPGEEAGLVVKWYHGRNPRPVYQWIPGSAPQALGVLRGRLDLRYRSSPDLLKAHSALAFVSPTTDLGGDYTCRVATYFAEQSATGALTIYTPASEFDLKMSKPTYGKVVIQCSAYNIFPQPNIALFKTDTNTGRRSLMDSRLQRAHNGSSDLYSVAVEASILGHQLFGETEFECLLTIPGTNYRLKETLLYYPGVINSATAEAVSGRSVGNSVSGTEAQCSLLVFSLIMLLGSLLQLRIRAGTRIWL